MQRTDWILHRFFEDVNRFFKFFFRRIHTRLHNECPIKCWRRLDSAFKFLLPPTTKCSCNSPWLAISLCQDPFSPYAGTGGPEDGSFTNLATNQQEKRFNGGNIQDCNRKWYEKCVSYPCAHCWLSASDQITALKKQRYKISAEGVSIIFGLPQLFFGEYSRILACNLVSQTRVSKDEFISEDSNSAGSLSMANTGQANSGGSQFFINVARWCHY